VLEVRSREVPFILEHGQIVGRLVYEKMLARPDASCTASASARTIRRRA
jgi:deoxycytidine triphosphate deaminase